MGKFDGIIIASDIDGTFVDSKSQIVPRNIEKIKYFTENGGKFTFSSGRASFDVGMVVPNIESIANAPLVLCNGCYLFDYGTKEIENPIILDNALTSEMIRCVLSAFPDTVFRITAQHGFISSSFEKVIKHLPEKWWIFVNTRPVDDLGNDVWYKIVFVDTPENLVKILDFCKEKYPTQFTYTKSWLYSLEICPCGVSKAVQLKHLKEKLSKDGKSATLFCIGDYDNDIEMLRFADTAVCPANALDVIKDVCSVHVCSNDDGAIADLIEYIENQQKIQ